MPGRIMLNMNTNNPSEETNDQPEDPVVPLVSELETVDENHPDAPQNEVSIEDNNGGRIELGEDGSDDNIIKK